MQGVYSEANLQRDDGKLVGQVHPILKPPDHDNGTSICAGRTATATKASTRINLPNNEEAERYNFMFSFLAAAKFKMHLIHQ